MEYNNNSVTCDSNNKKESNKKIIIIIITVITVIAVSIAVFVVASSKGRELKKQLNLGQKYLTEMKYEEAIASFEKVLGIEPANTEAYIGIADAYIGMGDLEAAKNTLEKGIEVLGKAGKDTSALEAKLKIVEDEIARLETEEEERKKAEELSLLKNKWKEFDGIYSRVCATISDSTNGDMAYIGVYITRDKREELLTPVINELEDYIDFILNSGYELDEHVFVYPENDDIHSIQFSGANLPLYGAYKLLVYLYLRIDDMDKAYITRKAYCDYFSLDGYANGVHTDAEGNMVDEYGRDVSKGQVYERSYCIEHNLDGKRYTYEYDNEGKQIASAVYNDGICTNKSYFDYSGDNVKVTLVNTKFNYESTMTYIISEYGYVEDIIDITN